MTGEIAQRKLCQRLAARPRLCRGDPFLEKHKCLLLSTPGAETENAVLRKPTENTPLEIGGQGGACGTMQRFLQLEALKAKRLEAFDEWARQYAESVTQMELNNSGTGYVPVTRF